MKTFLLHTGSLVSFLASTGAFAPGDDVTALAGHVAEATGSQSAGDALAELARLVTTPDAFATVVVDMGGVVDEALPLPREFAVVVNRSFDALPDVEPQRFALSRDSVREQLAGLGVISGDIATAIVGMLVSTRLPGADIDPALAGRAYAWVCDDERQLPMVARAYLSDGRCFEVRVD